MILKVSQLERRFSFLAIACDHFNWILEVSYMFNFTSKPKQLLKRSLSLVFVFFITTNLFFFSGPLLLCLFLCCVLTKPKASPRNPTLQNFFCLFYLCYFQRNGFLFVEFYLVECLFGRFFVRSLFCSELSIFFCMVVLSDEHLWPRSSQKLLKEGDWLFFHVWKILILDFKAHL